MKLIKKCAHCKKIFYKPINESKKRWAERHIFCSRSCLNLSMKGVGIKGAVKFKEGQVSLNKTHGLSKTRFYGIWCEMRRRCNDSTRHNYKWYGGKGIRVCDRWNVFDNFRDDMYSKYLEHIELFGEKNTTIDRQNSSDGYLFENCKWATLKEQGHNRRKTIK
jgi:hypothetical protein